MAASLAVEWAKKGVRVNCLAPGYMLTKLTKTILSHDQELKVSLFVLLGMIIHVYCRKPGKVSPPWAEWASQRTWQEPLSFWLVTPQAS